MMREGLARYLSPTRFYVLYDTAEVIAGMATVVAYIEAQRRHLKTRGASRG